MTGFATSVIGCKCEAGIERELAPDETPDGRPGVGALLFAMDREGVGKRLVERVGQCVLTSPTAACFNGLDAEDTVDVGGQLRFFGDGYQASKVLEGKRYWRVPVMEGEFLVQERFGVVEGGELRETDPGRLLRVGAEYDLSIEPTLEKLFEDRYSVQFSSYPVREPWLLEPARTVAAR